MNSNPTAVVSAGALAPPVNLSLPTITGTAKVGQTLTASPGTWSGSPTAYFYYWRRCDANGHACATVPAARTSTKYVLSSADVGYTIRVAVFARNAAGQTYVNSNQTAPGIALSSSDARHRKTMSRRPTPAAHQRSARSVHASVQHQRPPSAILHPRLRVGHRPRRTGSRRSARPFPRSPANRPR